jgi:hypothetical protein
VAEGIVAAEEEDRVALTHSITRISRDTIVIPHKMPPQRRPLRTLPPKKWLP